MSLIIGLTGLAGSGKGEVSKHLMENHDFIKFVFSDILKEEANKQNLLKSKTYEEQKYVLSKLGEKMRKESGRWDILAIKLVEKIKNGDTDKIVVDGFRSVEEVNLFRKNFENFYLVHIHTDIEKRFDRRRKEDSNAKIENFEKRDRENMQIMGLDKVLDMASFKIDNNNSLENLHERINDVLNKTDY